MQLDSLNTKVDSVVTDSINEISDSLAFTMKTPEQLGISISSGLLDSVYTVGDTFNYPITISWSVSGSSILVVPISSLNAKGITQLGLSQESSRTVKDGKEIAQITMNFKVLVQDTGNLTIPVMRFELPTPMGEPLEMQSESVPIRVVPPTNPILFLVPFIVALCVASAGFLRIYRKKKAIQKVEQKQTFENNLVNKMMILKQRVNTANSREWLLELEFICKIFALNKVIKNSFNDEIDEKEVSSVNLEKLQTEGKLENWETLLEEFAHARYGGGNCDSFEMKEIWKAAMNLMNIEEE